MKYRFILFIFLIALVVYLYQRDFIPITVICIDYADATPASPLKISRPEMSDFI